MALSIRNYPFDTDRKRISLWFSRQCSLRRRWVRNLDYTKISWLGQVRSISSAKCNVWKGGEELRGGEEISWRATPEGSEKWSMLLVIIWEARECEHKLQDTGDSLCTSLERQTPSSLNLHPSLHPNLQPDKIKHLCSSLSEFMATLPRPFLSPTMLPMLLAPD